MERSVAKNIPETSDFEVEPIANIEQSINTSGSDDSEKSIKNITKNSTYRKMAFRKLYKGPKRFYPGEKLHCSFQSTSNIELDDESINVLKSMLSTKKRKITEKIQQLFPGKKLNFRKKPIEYPCPVKHCIYQGPKLKRHLQSKNHKFSEEKARTYESFVRTSVNCITLILKYQSHKPNRCHICKAFFERIDSHYNTFHHLKRNSMQMERALEKSNVLTQEFSNKYYRKNTTPVNSSDNDIAEQSPSSTIATNPIKSKSKVMLSDTVTRDPPEQEATTATKPKSKVMPSQTVTTDTTKQENKLNIENVSKKMPQSSSGGIRLRGLFQKPTPAMQKKKSYTLKTNSLSQNP